MCLQTGLSCESRGNQPHSAPAQKSYHDIASATNKRFCERNKLVTDLQLSSSSSAKLRAPSHRCMSTASMTRMRQLRVVLIFLWTVSGACADFGGLYLAPVCNVTETSGLTTDCARIISYLQFLGNADCCVHEHNECTTMRAAGTCRARICTLPFLPLPKCQPCRVVAEYVRNVDNLCAEPVSGESRSGGLQVMREDSSLYIVLY